MLAKERSNMQVQEIQKALKQTEIRFQRIVETAIEGILIFDKDYRVTFANKNMASILGYTALEHEYSRLRRSNSKLSIILFDIDYFKEYNDYYGHVMGDECLRRIGSVLAWCINRAVDLAAR